VGLRSKRTEQAQIELGYPAYSAFHPDRYALDVMNGILGEGMSSRLFVEVREERGLAYSVNSQTSRFQDAGAFIVSASVHPHKAAETISVVREALDDIRCKPVPEDELTKTKEYIKGRVLLRMEDSRAVASWLGGQELLLGEIISVDDVVRAVDAVTVEDVQRVAQDVIRDEEASLAIVGPYRSSTRFERLLN
jgi:predicted Zn-dependent peptidase